MRQYSVVGDSVILGVYADESRDMASLRARLTFSRQVKHASADLTGVCTAEVRMSVRLGLQGMAGERYQEEDGENLTSFTPDQTNI